MSVQGKHARGESGVYRDRRAVLHLPLVSLVSMGAGTKPRENGEFWGGRLGDVSVQGECARREELHMGMGGCSAAPIGCFVAQTQGGMVMVGLCEYVSVQGECARRVCKASVQGGKSFIWG